MARFLETMCIQNGRPRFLEGHQRRVDETIKHFSAAGRTAEVAGLSVEAILDQAAISGEGVFKCRITYELPAQGSSYIAYIVTYRPYIRRRVRSLRLIELPAGYDYRYKYADRSVIEELYTQKGEADDILMTRQGWITDTSVANIAFLKNNRWYTPLLPLLAGTTWKRLVADGTLIPRPIHRDELNSFEAFKIFNAMNDWDESEAEPVVYY